MRIELENIFRVDAGEAVRRISPRSHCQVRRDPDFYSIAISSDITERNRRLVLFGLIKIPLPSQIDINDCRGNPATNPGLYECLLAMILLT